MICYSLPNFTDKDMTYDYKIKLFTTKTFKNYPIISRKFTASVSYFFSGLIASVTLHVIFPAVVPKLRTLFEIIF